MANITYKPNAVGMFALTRAPSGEVGRDLAKRGHRLVNIAQRQVGVKSGFLRASIHSTLSLGTTGLAVTVGSSASIALLHHNGVKPHVIVPRGTGVLRFGTGGSITHAQVVLHPGVKPNRYLTDNLARVVLT